MTQIQESSSIGKQAGRALRREMWYTQGKFEAFEFILENTNNVKEIKARIQEIEERLTDPILIAGPMAPDTSTRISREGYLAGLKDALRIISSAA
jgi:hypothetical protein